MRSEWVRARPGFVGGAFLAGYGAFRFVIEFVREPDEHLGFIFGMLSQGQILSLPMVLIGAAVMVYVGRKRA
jgi:phosphatidylglycerol:prolipoprotein diacylglycerol transferase